MTAGQNFRPEMSNPNGEKHNALVLVFLPLSLSFAILFSAELLVQGCERPPQVSGAGVGSVLSAP